MTGDPLLDFVQWLVALAVLGGLMAFFHYLVAGLALVFRFIRDTISDLGPRKKAGARDVAL